MTVRIRRHPRRGRGSLDVFDAHTRLSSAHAFDQWAKTLTSIAIWVVIPAVIGVARSIRREVK
jgi:hypothetical protein